METLYRSALLGKQLTGGSILNVLTEIAQVLLLIVKPLR